MAAFEELSERRPMEDPEARVAQPLARVEEATPLKYKPTSLEATTFIKRYNSVFIGLGLLMGLAVLAFMIYGVKSFIG